MTECFSANRFHVGWCVGLGLLWSTPKRSTELERGCRYSERLLNLLTAAIHPQLSNYSNEQQCE